MLTNKIMISVSQDKLAVQATRVFPRAQYISGAVVYGAPSVPSYSLPLGQNWVMKSGNAPGSKQLKNLGQAVGGPELNLCLRASEDAVMLASCDAELGHGLDWIIIEAPAPSPRPRGPGQVRTSDCSTATKWSYTPKDNTTGGGSLIADVGSAVMLTDQHCADVDARPGDSIIMYRPTAGSCNGQRPSNQAFILNGTRLVVQQNGECVSASPCVQGDPEAQLALCITAQRCINSTSIAAESFHQQWSWLNGTRKLQLMGFEEVSSSALTCLDVDLNAGVSDAAGTVQSGRESASCIKLAMATDPTKCLGLLTVEGTSEYRTAALVPCADPTALWHYGSSYLNMTYGSMTNCHVGLSLDASPRCAIPYFEVDQVVVDPIASSESTDWDLCATGHEQTSLLARSSAVGGLRFS